MLLLFLYNYFIIIIFLIPAVIAQIVSPTAELVIAIGTQTNEANAEIETQPLTVEAKISKCSK